MKTIRNTSRGKRWALGLVPVLIAGWIGTSAVPALAHVWTEGDIFVAISDGQYQQFSATGAAGDLLQVGTAGRPDGGFTTGCAFSPIGFPPVTPKLYTTVWHENRVQIVPDGTHTISALNSIDTTAGTNTVGHPETIVFDTDGNFYVGLVDEVPGTPNLLKYNAANVLQATYIVPVGSRGVDAIDLAADQTTLFYTSEDGTIRRYNVGTGTPMADFATGLERAYGLRLLQGSNPFGGAGGTGFLMVADSSNIKVFNAAGAVINTYDLAGQDGWFSVSISFGGTQFVAADYSNGRVVKFNANGTATAFTANPLAFRVNGVCVKGEVTVGVVPFPSEGFFVIGDIPAGYPAFTGQPNPNGPMVNFWGNDWFPNNPMSGGNGSAKTSFKGFAEGTVPTTSSCGGTYFSGGGNSSDPPDILPPRVAVIVTTAATSQGSTKSTGIIKAIVLVDTVSGTYNGAPGGAGFGRVVRVVCSI